MKGATTLPSVGLIAIPLPSASLANTLSGASVRGMISPLRGAYTESASTFTSDLGSTTTEGVFSSSLYKIQEATNATADATANASKYPGKQSVTIRSPNKPVIPFAVA